MTWWQHTGSNLKSDAEMDRLVRDVILDPDFSREDLQGFSAGREKRRIDEFQGDEDHPLRTEDGWRESSVKIPLPPPRHEPGRDEAPEFEVKGIWTRNLVSAIKSGLNDSSASKFFYEPYTLLRKTATPDDPGARPERLFSDVHNSDAFRREHEAVQALPREPGDSDDIPYSVVPIMVYSDSTHLTNFGNASLWPIYFWYLGMCKYVRALPSSFAAHHLAYIPKVG